jgi:guanylate kinase
MSHVFIISGPSGSGQDSIIESVSQTLPIERVITTTTREKRPTESEGHPYHFVTHEEFQKLSLEGEFVEASQSYNNEWYGVTKNDLDKAFASDSIVIWKVDYKGVEKIKTLFPQITAIYIEVPEETLRSRLLKRDKPDPKYLEDRMIYTKNWNARKELYDYCIQNADGQLEEAALAIKKIITERSAH